MIDSAKLSKPQLRALEDSVRRHEPFVVSLITLLEIALLSSDGRLKLTQSLDAIQASPAFRLLPLTSEIALEAGNLGILRDAADRVIAATARVHRLRLVTSDQRTIDSNTVTVVE
ncbi:MAG: type II toxin-antitoxin system VapC family toxin [Bryobacteraceae bacterium]|nr:type II toxin-antitoxin system VapC family toxin [Bryobacteraceae bacterium]